MSELLGKAVVYVVVLVVGLWLLYSLAAFVGDGLAGCPAGQHEEWVGSNKGADNSVCVPK